MGWTTEKPREPGWYVAKFLGGGIEVVFLEDTGLIWETGNDEHVQSICLTHWYLPALEMPDPPQVKPEPGLYAVRTDGRMSIQRVVPEVDFLCTEDGVITHRKWADVDFSKAVRLPDGGE